MAEVQKVYAVFGGHIRERRQAIGMTQEQLARYMSLSRPAICNIELGKQRVLLHDVLLFAKVLRCDYAYFLRGLPEPKPRDFLF